MVSVSYLDRPWLKFYEEGVPAQIDYEEICLPAILEKTARDFPDKTALIFEGYRLSFGELKDKVDRLATCLHEFGVKKGDAVAILLPNSVSCVIAYFAVLRLGAIVVMNNPLYTDVELKRQLTDSGAKVLITLDLLANRMINLRPQTAIKQIIYTAIGDYLPLPKKVVFSLLGKWLKIKASVNRAEEVYTLKECLEKFPPAPPPVTPTFDDVAVYQYTGGTTGITKGVELTHRNLSSQVQQCAAWFVRFKRGEEIMLSALPFFHVFGMTVCLNFSVYMGWTQVLVAKPQADALLRAIRKYRPSFTPLVPTMYVGMLSHPHLKKTDMSCIKGAFSGSAPLPVEIIREFERLTDAVIVEGYGLTEASPVTHANPLAGGGRKVGSIGVPVSDTLARIVDLEEGTRDVPVGEVGELIVRGPQVMKGYRGMPEETAYALRDGWLYTGDMARMDEDGYFYIVDRKKDLIITGGYNVYPREVEEVFYAHPKVKEACAIGIPDRKRGENIKVFVVLKEGVSATVEELLAFCRNYLAKYKWPTEIEFRQELPKSPVGKILRRQLREEEWSRRG